MASETKIIELTASNFDTQIKESGFCLVDFWAEWCGPCRSMNPVLSKLAEQLEGTVKFFKVNVDEEYELAARYNIQAIPNFVFFKQGEKVEQFLGYHNAEQLMTLIKPYI